MPDKMEFAKDAFVKVVGVSGDFHYGYIKEAQEQGFHLLICMHEEGDSAVSYEAACSGFVPSDWNQELTDVEKRIIPLLAQKLTTKNIAAALSVSPVTIRSQIRTLRFKLQMENRAQLIAYAQGLTQHLNRQEAQ